MRLVLFGKLVANGKIFGATLRLSELTLLAVLRLTGRLRG